MGSALLDIMQRIVPSNSLIAFIVLMTTPELDCLQVLRHWGVTLLGAANPMRVKVSIVQWLRLFCAAVPAFSTGVDMLDFNCTIRRFYSRSSLNERPGKALNYDTPGEQSNQRPTGRRQMITKIKDVYSMRRKITFIAVILVSLLGLACTGKQTDDGRVNNTSDELLERVTIDGVRAHQSVLQSIADANGGTRVSGTPGYDESAGYVASQMESAGYDVTMQQFQYPAFIRLGPSVLAQRSPVPTTYVDGIDHELMSQTDPGDVTALVTAVDLQLGPGNASTSGCEVSDFAAFPAGHIALIQRGTCSFQQKAENAAAAGAVGAIIFNQGNTNNRLGLATGSLGVSYSGGIPVLVSTYSLGEQWSMTAGLELRMVADVFRGMGTSYNVLAETTIGDPNNTIIVGAHLDSVNQAPGIQDNGSGSAAILETAVQMTHIIPRNKVRFAWWGAEESGLVGSRHYVSNLSQEELDQITLYLNFDMIGSPNYVFSIYDGDNSDGIGAGPGPNGSAQIEQTFELYYSTLGEPFKGTDFSGRSDYGPFIEVGIPSGGLFTGAEGIKTPDEAGLWGGTAGEQYDPCYHLACDTFDNISLKSLEVNSDAVAYATLKYAMDTSDIDNVQVKGNFVLKDKDTKSVGPLAIQ